MIFRAFFIILALMLIGATIFDFIESRFKDVEDGKASIIIIIGSLL